MSGVEQQDREAAKRIVREFRQEGWPAKEEELAGFLSRLRHEARKAALEELADAVEGKGGVIPLASAFVPLILGHNQPCMSGDMRDRLNPHKRRQFDDAMRDFAAAIRSAVGE